MRACLTRARGPTAPRPEGAAVDAEHRAGAGVEALRLAVLVRPEVRVRTRGDEPRAERWRRCRHCPLADPLADPAGGEGRTGHSDSARRRAPGGVEERRGHGPARARDAGARARDWREWAGGASRREQGGAARRSHEERGRAVRRIAWAGADIGWQIVVAKERGEAWSGGWAVVWRGVPEEEEEGVGGV